MWRFSISFNPMSHKWSEYIFSIRIKSTLKRPGNSPELNSIENLWSIHKRWLYGMDKHEGDLANSIILLKSVHSTANHIQIWLYMHMDMSIMFIQDVNIIQMNNHRKLCLWACKESRKYPGLEVIYLCSKMLFYSVCRNSEIQHL